MHAVPATARRQRITALAVALASLLLLASSLVPGSYGRVSAQDGELFAQLDGAEVLLMRRQLHAFTESEVARVVVSFPDDPWATPHLDHLTPQP